MLLGSDRNSSLKSKVEYLSLLQSIYNDMPVVSKRQVSNYCLGFFACHLTIPQATTMFCGLLNWVPLSFIEPLTAGVSCCRCSERAV